MGAPYLPSAPTYWTNATVTSFDESTSRKGILVPMAAGTRFTLARHAPSPALAPWIERYWSVRWDLPEGESYVSETLPHPAVNVVFEDCGSAVHGIPQKRFTRLLIGRARGFGVKFRPGAFAPFFSRPIHTLANQSLPLTEVFDAAITGVDESIRAIDDDAHAITTFEAFLRERLPPRDAELERLVAIMRLGLEDPAMSDVATFAARAGIEVRTMQRLFRRYVGVTPKWVLRRYRIQEAAERVAKREDVDFTRLAHELGYADQSHFVRDFKAHVGKTPAVYAASCRALLAQG